MRASRNRIALIVVVVLVALSAAAFGFDRYVLSQTYARVPARQVGLLPTYELYEARYARTDEQFELDGFTLRGHVYGAENERGLIVFRHGIFSQHQDYLPLITAMVDKGWRVFAYDAIGCGESDGESTLGMSQSPFDVAAAIDYVKDEGIGDGMPLVLWGHSWGGYGVAAALGLRDGVDACVTMSGYDTPMKILTYSATSSFGQIGAIQQPFLWLNTVIDFGADRADLSASEAVKNSGVPTLVVHGLHDTTVPYEGVSIASSLQGIESGSQGQTIHYILESDEGRDGHNSYFYSPKSQAYLNECASELQALLEENDEDATAPEVQDYLSHVDLRAANTADPKLVDALDGFLGEALGR